MYKALLVALGVLVVAGAFMLWPGRMQAPVEPGGRAMSIEQYVHENISELSPVKEQLGGTFYVTGMSADGGVGVVEYEDGHNAYTADFTYQTEPNHGAITITSFTVRQ